MSEARVIAVVLLSVLACAASADEHAMLTCLADRSVAPAGGSVTVTAYTGWEPAKVSWQASGGSLAETETGGDGAARWSSDELGYFTLSASATIDGQQRNCSVEVAVTDPTLAPSDDTAFMLLESEREEAAGFAVYSYVVFWDPVGDGNREEYRAFLEAFISTVPELAALHGRYLPEELNITYVPVTGQAPADLDSEWILDNYDNGRARSILSKLDISYRQGPAIVSFLGKPAGSEQDAEVVMQKFVGVSDHLRAPLIRAYVFQMTQHHDWGDTTARQMGLRLRNTAAHFGRGLTNARDEVGRWIGWFRLSD